MKVEEKVMSHISEEALIDYLYDEGDAAERLKVARHLHELRIAGADDERVAVRHDVLHARGDDAVAIQGIYAPFVTDSAISFELQPPTVDTDRSVLDRPAGLRTRCIEVDYLTTLIPVGPVQVPDGEGIDGT